MQITYNNIDDLFCSLLGTENEINTLDDSAKQVHKRVYMEQRSGISETPQFGLHFTNSEINSVNPKQILCFYKLDFIKDLNHIEEIKKAHLADKVYIGWVMKNQYCPIYEYGNEIRQFAAQVQLVKTSL